MSLLSFVMVLYAPFVYMFSHSHLLIHTHTVKKPKKEQQYLAVSLLKMNGRKVAGHCF